MKSLEEILDDVSGKLYEEKSIDLMKELINFIDKSLTQSFKLADSERSSFLALSLLSMRDFVSKELNESIIKTKLSKDIIEAVLKETSLKNQKQDSDSKKKEGED